MTEPTDEWAKAELVRLRDEARRREAALNEQKRRAAMFPELVAALELATNMLSGDCPLSIKLEHVKDKAHAILAKAKEQPK